MNWDDNLAGATEYGHLDPLVEKVRKKAEDKISSSSSRPSCSTCLVFVSTA